ncbi:MAG: aspartate aminotransferase family protein [Candidatus Omnitrophica bacterium]|nr:aspartate aminotransferase family protein [Candidatus Omnitrophota bacterium]
MTTNEIAKLYERYVIPTYSHLPLALVKGKGIKVWDVHQKEYLDFFSGWGVSNLGHCHPAVMNAVRNQVGKLLHIPNNYYGLLQAKLAREISKSSFNGKVFFCNSGAEANEAAIKFARKYGKGKRYEIISMHKSFHGRTLASLALTGQEKYHADYQPLPSGFKYVPFNDIRAIKEAVNEKTIAIVLELIQGEGGVNIADENYIKELRQICDKKDILLIFDEVQTGIGRTGKLFCYQHYEIEPDVMLLAKGLGGGVPIGALVVKKELADIFSPHSHASTFGGNPLVCKAGLAVFKAIKKEKLLKKANEMGRYLNEKLRELKEKYPFIKEVRGKGLMWGIELSIEGTEIVQKCLDKGLLINCTQEKILRIMPSLIIKKKEIDKGIGILAEVLQATSQRLKKR